MAPAFGEDDFQGGQTHELPVFRPVGPDGRFTDQVPDFAGIGVKEADKPILDALKAAGSLVDRRTLDHNYPHCYRCDTPLVYMALETWFMRIEPVKQRQHLRRTWEIERQRVAMHRKRQATPPRPEQLKYRQERAQP